MSDERAKAKEIVEFWKNRRWLQSSAPVHVHPLDLDKLEDLIVDVLEDREPKARAV
jgi:hypothetical protein